MIDIGSQRLHRYMGEDIEVVNITDYVLQGSFYQGCHPSLAVS